MTIIPRVPRSLVGDPLPLKPFVLQTLMVLAAGDQHGWGLLRALEARLGTRVLPGRLYRQLDEMLADGLIEERDRPARPAETRNEHLGGAEPRRFFRMTAIGRRALEAEGRRLEGLVSELRTSGLLPSRRRP